MSTTEAQKRARNKWNKENMKELYDRGNILFPKGQKEIIQGHATEQGESLNAFINRAISETIERDKQKASE